MVNVFPSSQNLSGKPIKLVWSIGQNEVGSVRRTDSRLAEELGIPDSSGSASLVAENLALWLWDCETGSYFTPCPMMDHPPSVPRAQRLAESSCLSAERGKQRVHMSIYMCNDPQLDSYLNFEYLHMTNEIKLWFPV